MKKPTRIASAMAACFWMSNYAVAQEVLWEFSTSGPVYGSPAIGTDGTIYIGSINTDKFYALGGKTGAIKWEFIAGSGIRSSPAIGENGYIYFGSWDKKIYALAARSGAKKWEFVTGGLVEGSSPAVSSDGTVFVGSTDGSVYALSRLPGCQQEAIFVSWHGWIY